MSAKYFKDEMQEVFFHRNELNGNIQQERKIKGNFSISTSCKVLARLFLEQEIFLNLSRPNKMVDWRFWDDKTVKRYVG